MLKVVRLVEVASPRVNLERQQWESLRSSTRDSSTQESMSRARVVWEATKRPGCARDRKKRTGSVEYMWKAAAVLASKDICTPALEI